MGLKETPLHQPLEQVTSPQDPGPGEPPLRGRLAVEGASILTRCPEPETYQVNRHKMIRLRPWGAEWLAPSPTLSPTHGIIPFSSRNPDLFPTGQNTDTGLDTFNGGIMRTGRPFPGLGWDGVAEEGVTFKPYIMHPFPTAEPCVQGITPPLSFPPTAFQVLNPRPSHRGEDIHTLERAKAHTVTQGVERDLSPVHV